jgi:hypothetical protein
MIINNSSKLLQKLYKKHSYIIRSVFYCLSMVFILVGIYSKKLVNFRINTKLLDKTKLISELNKLIKEEGKALINNQNIDEILGIDKTNYELIKTNLNKELDRINLVKFDINDINIKLGAGLGGYNINSEINIQMYATELINSVIKLKLSILQGDTKIAEKIQTFIKQYQEFVKNVKGTSKFNDLIKNMNIALTTNINNIVNTNFDIIFDNSRYTTPINTILINNIGQLPKDVDSTNYYNDTQDFLNVIKNHLNTINIEINYISKIKNDIDSNENIKTIINEILKSTDEEERKNNILPRLMSQIKIIFKDNITTYLKAQLTDLLDTFNDAEQSDGTDTLNENDNFMILLFTDLLQYKKLQQIIIYSFIGILTLYLVLKLAVEPYIGNKIGYKLIKGFFDLILMLILIIIATIIMSINTKPILHNLLKKYFNFDISSPNLDPNVDNSFSNKIEALIYKTILNFNTIEKMITISGTSVLFLLGTIIFMLFNMYISGSLLLIIGIAIAVLSNLAQFKDLLYIPISLKYGIVPIISGIILIILNYFMHKK